MKVYHSDVTFNYPWEEVSTANWRKYCPWNDKSTHVIAVDTLSRSVDPETGILRTERLLTCEQGAPRWIRALMMGSDCLSHVHEVSWVDPASKRVTMRSTNLTWANALRVRETVIYQPSPLDPAHKTQFQQDARITALGSSSSSSSSSNSSGGGNGSGGDEESGSDGGRCGFGWQRVRNRIEEFTVDRFRQNAQRGREGFESVLETSRRVFGEEREQLRNEEQENNS